MTEGQGGGGGRQKPTDDRTLLDPLNEDELKALREARQRMQAKKAAQAAAKKPGIVIGPDTSEDIGDAPTRAMPALPQFDGGVSLDQIKTGSFQAAQPQKDPSSTGGPPQEPMSMPGTSGTQSDASATRPLVEAAPPAHDPQVTITDDQPPPQMSGRSTPQVSSSPGVSQTAPSAGPPVGGSPGRGPGPKGKVPGFGENTLLWMQPPKPAERPTASPTGDIIPKADQKAATVRRAKTFATIGVTAAVVAALLIVTLPKSRGAIELHTNPPKAAVKINGSLSDEVTPVRLTLAEGEHEIELNLEGHKVKVITVTIEGDQTTRQDVDLHPMSREGMLTVSINVSPVGANISLDGKIHPGKRKLMVPNIDPSKAHKIVIEAPGYIKIEQEIAPSKLKSTYDFVLQQDGKPM